MVQTFPSRSLQALTSPPLQGSELGSFLLGNLPPCLPLPLPPCPAQPAWGWWAIIEWCSANYSNFENYAFDANYSNLENYAFDLVIKWCSVDSQLTRLHLHFATTQSSQIILQFVLGKREYPSITSCPSILTWVSFLQVCPKAVWHTSKYPVAVKSSF